MTRQEVEAIDHRRGTATEYWYVPPGRLWQDRLPVAVVWTRGQCTCGGVPSKVLDRFGHVCTCSNGPRFVTALHGSRHSLHKPLAECDGTFEPMKPAPALDNSFASCAR